MINSLMRSKTTTDSQVPSTSRKEKMGNLKSTNPEDFKSPNKRKNVT